MSPESVAALDFDILKEKFLSGGRGRQERWIVLTDYSEWLIFIFNSLVKPNLLQ